MMVTEITNLKGKDTLKIDDFTYILLDKNEYSFKLKVVLDEEHKEKYEWTNHSEWLLNYNLRKGDMELIRDGRKVLPNEGNLDDFLPRASRESARRYRRNRISPEFFKKESIIKITEMISPDEYPNMYDDLFDILSKNGKEYVPKLSRSLSRLINDYNGFELLYKIKDLKLNDLYDYNKDYMKTSIFKANRDGKTKPHQMLDLTKPQYHFLNHVRSLIDQYHEQDDRRTYYNHRDVFNLYNYNDMNVDQINKLRGIIEMYIELCNEYGKEVDLYDFLSDSNTGIIAMADYCYKMNNPQRRNVLRQRNIYQFAEDNNHDVRRLIEYLYFECDLRQGIRSVNTAFRLYFDYVRMANEMEWNYERYPTSLKLRHDITNRNYRVNLDDIQIKQFSKIVEKKDYEELVFKGKEYSVLIPKEPNDVTKEGNDLSHCVSSYIKDINSERTKILFIRSNDDLDKSLLTLQITGDEIVQCRGQSNRGMEPVEAEFLKAYAKNKELTIAEHVTR